MDPKSPTITTTTVNISSSSPADPKKPPDEKTIVSSHKKLSDEKTIVSPLKKQKRYICQYCDRAFSRSEHRSRHERSHTKERPYHCGQCSSTFVRRDLLLRHNRTVHAESKNNKNGVNNNAQQQTAQTSTHPEPSKNNITFAPPNKDIPKSTTYRNETSKPNPIKSNVTPSSRDLNKVKGQTLATNSAPPTPPPSNTPQEQGDHPTKKRKFGIDTNNNLSSPKESIPNSPSFSSSPQIDSTIIKNNNEKNNYFLHSQSKSNIEEATARTLTELGKASIKKKTPSVYIPPNSFFQSPTPSFISTASTSSTAVPSPLNQYIPISKTHLIDNSSNSSPKLAVFSPNTSSVPLPMPPKDLHFDRWPTKLPPIGNLSSNIGKLPSYHNSSNNLSQTYDTPSPSTSKPQVPKKTPMAHYIPRIKSNFYFTNMLDSLKRNPKCDLVLGDIYLLTKLKMNQYLATYFLYFQHQLPFIHTRTFNPETTEHCLLFALCAIGAILNKDEKMSGALFFSALLLTQDALNIEIHGGSQNLPNESPIQSDTSGGNKKLLWASQTLLALLIFVSWSKKEQYLSIYRNILFHLVPTIKKAVENISLGQSLERKGSQIEAFIEDQSIIRTYYSTFITTFSLCAIYNYYSTEVDILVASKDIDMPCDEDFWNYVDMQTDEQQLPTSSIKYNSAFDYLGKKDERNPATEKMSPFTVRILTTTLLSKYWKLKYVNFTPKIPIIIEQDNRRLLEELDSLEVYGLKNLDTKTNWSGDPLYFFDPFLTELSLDMDETIEEQYRSQLLKMVSSNQHPMVITSYFVSMVIRVRVLLNMPNITLNWQTNSSEIWKTYQGFKNSGQLRGEKVCQLVSKCFEIFRLVSVSGMQKTPFRSFFLLACPELLWSFFELCLVVIMWTRQYEDDYLNSSNQIGDFDNKLYKVIGYVSSETGIIDPENSSVSFALAKRATEAFFAFGSEGFSYLLGKSIEGFFKSLKEGHHELQKSSASVSPSSSHLQLLSSDSGRNNNYSPSNANIQQATTSSTTTYSNSYQLPPLNTLNPSNQNYSSSFRENHG